MSALPREQDQFDPADPAFQRGLVEHMCRQSIERLFECTDFDDARWIISTAIIDAERKTRTTR